MSSNAENPPCSQSAVTVINMLEMPSITLMMELPLMTTGQLPSIRMIERGYRVENVHQHIYNSPLKDLSLHCSASSIDGRADELRD